AAIVVLIALRRRAFASAREPVMSIAAIGAAVASYLAVYALAFPHLASFVTTSQRLAELSRHAGEAWKALVVPFGAVVVSPNRLRDLYGVADFWRWLVPAAMLVAVGHAWFWREFFRRDDTRLTFVAGGLMLFFYATVAGILWGRVPRFGFDYFMQPRYFIYYAPQLVAMLMIAASNAARPERPSTPFVAYAASVVVLGGAAIAYGRNLNVHWNIDFNRMLDAKLIALAED